MKLASLTSQVQVQLFGKSEEADEYVCIFKTNCKKRYRYNHNEEVIDGNSKINELEPFYLKVLKRPYVPRLSFRLSLILSTFLKSYFLTIPITFTPLQVSFDSTITSPPFISSHTQIHPLSRHFCPTIDSAQPSPPFILIEVGNQDR